MINIKGGIQLSYLISIIIPIYNAENYIETGLKSIMNQSIGFKNLEVVCVNDNSTDSTLEILKPYGEKYENIKIINLNENHGHPGIPRNIGIESASSDYIMFMDQDDYFEHQGCEILYKKIIKENVDIVSGRWYKLVDGIKIPFRPLESEIKIKNIKEDPTILGQPSFLWVKIFKKSLLQKNNIDFPETGIEDVVFTSHAFLKANGIIMLKDEYVYTHFVNQDSISRSKTKYYLNQLLIGYQKAYERFLENEYQDFFKYLINMRLHYFLKTMMRSELTQKDSLEIIIQFQKFYIKSKTLGATPGEKLELLFNLIETNHLENALWLINKLKKMDKLGQQNKILKSKNKILKSKNKNLIKENKNLKTQLKRITPLKGYILYKIKVNKLNE